MSPKRYVGEQLDLTWDRRLCIHVGECGRADGDLFVAGRDPWCQPDVGSAAEAIDVVHRCPSGALAYEPKEASVAPDSAPARNLVQVVHHGPLYVSGDLDVGGAEADMAGVAFRAALCRCGLSARKPFCDNSHEEGGFQDRGAVGRSGDATPPPPNSGGLRVRRRTDGPLKLTGPLTIVASSGRQAWHGKEAILCRCGHSKNKPFCDGAHKAAGFQAEGD